MLFNLSALSEISSSCVIISFLMKLFLIRWETVNDRGRHAFYSNCFPTLRKTIIFCLRSCTNTPALSNFLLRGLHFAYLLILSLESLDRIYLLSSLLDWRRSSIALLFSQIKALKFFVGLGSAKHMNWIPIPCRLGIYHLWKNICRIAHAWAALRPSSRSPTLPIALWSASF